MRFLQSNPAAEANKVGSKSPDEKAIPQERVYAGKSVPYDFRRPRTFDQMASDRFGEELAPDAAIWNMYLDEAQEHDRELVEGRQRSLDTLLLFAALFSAILTAFLIESKDLLQQDPAEASAALLLIIAQSQQRMELGLPPPEPLAGTISIPEFAPSLSARWINGIWFMSLGLSLSAALVAMLGKEWLTTFHSSRPRSARRLAFIRQSRLKGLENWGALHIIALLPTLLHVSLLLFSVGLVVYLWALDAALAAVLSGVIGITLTFYIVTGILGAVYEFCPFVTEVSEYMQRAVTMLFKMPSKDLNGESVVPSMQYLQALVWLCNRSGDPFVVDYGYQAIAGLYQSSYVELDTAQPRLAPSPNSTTTNEALLFDHDLTMNSLFLKVSGRFDDLLAGTLETGSAEPPVCRYINAMIVLRSYADSSPKHWLDMMETINRFWRSNLPQRSLSGSSFAGVLIAEMDVLKLTMSAIDIKPPRSPIKNSAPKERIPINYELVNSNDYIPAHQYQHIVEISATGKRPEPVTPDLFSILNNYLTEWLDASLTMLQSHAKGTVHIDTYLLNSLFRATSDGAYYLKCMYPILDSQTQTPLTPQSGETIFASLNILMDLLSQPFNSKPESITQLTEVLKTYSHIVHILPHLTSHNGSVLAHELSFHDFNLNPPVTRGEILWITTRYMLSLAGHICSLQLELPQYQSLFATSIELVFRFHMEDRSYGPDYFGPRRALSYHVSDYIKILEFLESHSANIGGITRITASYLCDIAADIWLTTQDYLAFHIPPSCFLTLIRLYAHSHFDLSTAQGFMTTIVNRLRNSSILPGPLPPQSSPVPEPRPTIEYLQQFTHCAGGFSMLTTAGLISTNYTKAVSAGIADITIIAANRDPALTVNPVGLRAQVVPEFLKAVSWALPHLASEEDGRARYSQFVVAASILLVVACQDPEAKEQINLDSNRRNLFVELLEKKDFYLGIISQEEWKRLVIGLDKQAGDRDGLDKALAKGLAIESEKKSEEHSGAC
ncbi:hypothetical protein OPQ81_009079 [Rhizoctonia solani]|nr:hypothetical protein OPQ81_009079 [Rhizoctonia solani]